MLEFGLFVPEFAHYLIDNPLNSGEVGI